MALSKKMYMQSVMENITSYELLIMHWKLITASKEEIESQNV